MNENCCLNCARLVLSADLERRCDVNGGGWDRLCPSARNNRIICEACMDDIDEDGEDYGCELFTRRPARERDRISIVRYSSGSERISAIRSTDDHEFTFESHHTNTTWPVVHRICTKINHRVDLETRLSFSAIGIKTEIVVVGRLPKRSGVAISHEQMFGTEEFENFMVAV